MKRILSVLLSIILLLPGTGFAQIPIGSAACPPAYLRCLSFENPGSVRMYLDSPAYGDTGLSAVSRTAFNYFLTGLALPDSSFWVNLRPDQERRMIDDDLARTDLGRIMLEADLQLKKDLARAMSVDQPEGKEYWDRLYRKAEELFGGDKIDIPTLSRPWIVPDEIIVRETPVSAYIYKATLKVMLEQDHLKGRNASAVPADERFEALNEYSARLLRELIIPGLTIRVNGSACYSGLRQVYHCLILSQWFKARFGGKPNAYARLIDKRDLSGLCSRVPWSRRAYFGAYRRSFRNGEYTSRRTGSSSGRQLIRTYTSGGEDFTGIKPAVSAGSVPSLSEPKPGSDVTAVDIVNPSKKARVNPEALVYFPAPAQAPIPSDQPKPPSTMFYVLDYPLRLINPDAKVSFRALGDEQTLAGRLERNIYYAGASPSRKQRILKRVGSLVKAVPYIKEYLREKHPDLEVINISVYGSYIKGLDGVSRSDIDLLVMVKGNRFLAGDDLPIDRSDSRLDGIPENINKWSVYLIGLDNMQLSVIDLKDAPEGAHPGRWWMRQRMVAAGTAPVLYRRNVVVDGFEFLENDSLFRENLLARAGELLNNAYRRMYLYKLVTAESEYDRWSVAAARLHDVFLALALYDPAWKFTMTEEDILDMRVAYEMAYRADPQAAKRLVERAWREFDEMYEKKAQEKRRMDVPADPREAASRMQPDGGMEFFSAARGSGEKTGGIDFRFLPLFFLPGNGFFAKRTAAPGMDIEKEWREITRLTAAGTVPSGQRLKEYVQSVYSRGEFERKSEDIVLGIRGILKLEEAKCIPTGPVLREVVSAVEGEISRADLRNSLPDFE